MHFNWSKIVLPSLTSANPADLQKFEAGLEYDLPNDYRDFLLEINGGKVLVEHEIKVPDTPFGLGVDFLLPLTATSPSMGVVEARDIQVRNRLCLRQAIEIGDDMGTGRYYLILAGEKCGAIYFIWNDDRPTLSGIEWEAWDVSIPSDMIEISNSFDALGETIIAHSRRG
jgi:hypothetical protein